MTGPRAGPGRLRAGWLALVALALVAGGLAGAAVTPLAVEGELLTAVVASAPPALTTVAHTVTRFGDLWLVVVVAAAVALVVRNRPEAARIHLLLLLGIGGATGIVAVLKVVVARARPELALVSTWTSAYPSGHAARAAAAYGLVVWACHRHLRHHVALRLAGVVVALTLVIAIAWSRIHLAVHLPTDVVVGLLIGAVWLLAVLRAVPAPAAAGGSERHRGAAPTRAVTRRRDRPRPPARAGGSRGVGGPDG